MKVSALRISRRNFIAVSAIASLPASVTAPSTARPHFFASEKISKKVVIRQVVFRGKHPVMDNPHLRTRTQVDRLVEKAAKLYVAYNIKLMALSHFLKQPISPSE
ncbi:MAG: hypothetical protein GY768_27140 [Planctomycetaceae bacterium]|nr:hypothetical protein [Planctomycetaceae bacterium]